MGIIHCRIVQDDEGGIEDVNLKTGNHPVARLKRECGTRWTLRVIGQDREITLRIESREEIRVTLG